MKRLGSILGYAGAGLTIALAVVTPFLLLGWFQTAIGGLGLRIAPQFSGGEIARVVQRAGYRIVVNRPVTRSSPLQRTGPFIQLTWEPAAALPAQVSDAVDVDGDGTPDLLVSFDTRKLEVNVSPRNGRYQAIQTKGVASFSKLIARVKDGVTVRVPLNN